MNISTKAVEIYNNFKSLPGSEHIAKPTSISALLLICEEKKPKRVLELGGGIGTISHTLLTHSDAFVDIYEDNDYCIKRLRENLRAFQGRFSIIEDYRILPPAREYDVVIIDGGDGAPKDGGYGLAIWLFLHYIKSVRVVYVEGYRVLQRAFVRRALGKRFILKFTRYKDVYNKGVKWHGGLRIDCSECSSGIVRFLRYVAWEIAFWLRGIILSSISRIKRIFR